MKAILFFAALMTSLPVYALPINQIQPLSSELPHTFTDKYNFEGIVRLSNCSGSLVRFTTSKDTDPAMVLTNGHCMEGGFTPPNEFVYGEGSSRSFTLMRSNGSSAGRVSANLILYGTMTKTDMALYRLTQTYAQIKSQFNIQALTLAEKPAPLSTRIEVISGYWQRGYSCAVEAYIHRLLEGDWEWSNSMRYSRPGCEVIGGTSGSPVIDTITRQVIGVNNTGNESGRKCTDNNPCEIDENGDITFEEGYSYAQQTYWIYSCLNENREIDLNLANCELFH